LEKNLAIIIVNYNGVSGLKELFFKVLDSVLDAVRGVPGVDVWFVDNGSTDDSVRIVQEKYGNMSKILTLGRNVGYGGACNLAYAYTNKLGLRYRFYACINNDIVIDSGRFRNLLAWLKILDRMSPKGFIATPILINGYIEGLDFGGYFIDSSGGAWPLRFVIRSAEKLANVLRLPLPVSYADGAFIIFHRAVIEKIGFFEPRFFLYGEDVEVCLRAWQNDIPSLLIPVIVGKHYRSTTTSIIKRIQVYMQVRNRVYNALRYFGLHGLIKTLIWYALYPIRLIDSKHVIVGKLLEEVGLNLLGTIQNLGGDISTIKLITRAFIDGIRWARKNKKGQNNTLKGSSGPVLGLPISSLVSTKALLNNAQVALLDRLYQHLEYHKQSNKLQTLTRASA